MDIGSNIAWLEKHGLEQCSCIWQQLKTLHPQCFSTHAQFIQCNSFRVFCPRPKARGPLSNLNYSLLNLPRATF